MRIHKLAILGLPLAVAAFAQPEPPGPGPLPSDAADPPSRVARLNMINGPVSFRPASVEDWTAAQVNYPMTTGDHLWTDTGATAEMHVGSTAIRMDRNTALAIVNLNDQIIQLSVTAGSLQVHVRYIGPNENIEVDTPNAAVMLLRPGDYRINSDGENNVTMMAVRQGDAEVTAGGKGINVRAGESARMAGVDQVSEDLGPMLPNDPFDDWCHSRDAREDRAVQSARYVPREMGGYEDLDGYGVWTESPQWGWVWRPTGVAAGWAPYHSGHWAWVAPWGWTWVDDAPWGFAPFHYGRWGFYGGAWVWVPGAVAVRPVYSPALVAFVGGGGFSVGVGGGGVAAWFALGPGEVYRPAYHVTDVYVRNVNVAYVRDVTVINRVGPVTYVNQGVVGAVTVVPHGVFVSARPVAVAAIVVPQREIIAARVTGYTAPIPPERASVVGAVSVNVRVPPAMVVNRVVVARNAPPPPPVSFAAQQQALRENGGRPLAPQQVETFRPAGQRYNQQVHQVSAPQTFGRPNNAGPQGPGAAPNNNLNRPQNTQPMYRNDRPPSAQPNNPNNGQNNGRTFGEPRGGQPANQPETRPAGQSVTNQNHPVTPEARPAGENRPASEVHTPASENRPNEVRGESRSEGRNNEKAPPRKGSNNTKKEEKKDK